MNTEHQKVEFLDSYRKFEENHVFSPTKTFVTHFLLVIRFTSDILPKNKFFKSTVGIGFKKIK
jgi:hypothetical protein